MKKAIERAIDNVAEHGDTDIFPYPIENLVIFDKKKEIRDLLVELDKDFDKFITTSPPSNYGALAPVGYNGFRWATQIDPLWNVYFLSLVISIADKIENARISKSKECVHSYRYDSDQSSSFLFVKESGWRSCIEKSIEHCKDYQFVVSCDISEFYPRLNHHRLDNALRQLPNADAARNKIMDFLSNFSETYSFGLPVGGPAARLLSELTLNQIDRLLVQKRIKFCRFADDFYLFANSQEDAFKYLVYLSEILHRNQGLQLQKSKTRIMSAAEFLATNPLSMDENDSEIDKLTPARKSLLSLSLFYDPYSATAEEDYKNLQGEIEKFPVLDLIRAELTKSKVDLSLSRKLVKTLKFISNQEIDDAAKTLIENDDLLYPIYFNVCSAVKGVWDRISEPSKSDIVTYIISRINDGAPSLCVDLNLQYAIQIIGLRQSEEGAATLTDLYERSSSAAIKRDIILIMARWRDWGWISDKRANFRTMSAPERRAFIVASYSLKDEGKHWRTHTSNEFSALEQIVQTWISERVNTSNWEIPV